MLSDQFVKFELEKKEQTSVSSSMSIEAINVGMGHSWTGTYSLRVGDCIS